MGLNPLIPLELLPQGGTGMVKTGTATPMRPKAWRECRGWDTWPGWAGDKAVCLALAAVLQLGAESSGLS